MDRFKTFIIIVLLSILPTILLWLPFIFRIPNFWGIPLPNGGMGTIVANYDGPLYIVVARTLYDKAHILQEFSFPLKTEYYAAHFPLFPFLIRIFSYLFGYAYGMLTVTVLSSIAALLFFYKLAREWFEKENALWLTFVFAILPARWLIVRSVGSPEPLFLAAIIACLYYFNRKNYLLSGIFGGLAAATKSPGILLFPALLFSAIFPVVKNFAHTTIIQMVKDIKPLRLIPLLLIPAFLVGVFYIYRLTYGDFFAYFKSGDNIHLFFPPFQIFNSTAPWVGTFWLEEIIFVYMLLAGGVILLFKKRLDSLAWFTSLFLLSLIFVSHRDIVRYALPIIPFVVIGYGDILTKKEFKYLIIFIFIPIFLFSLSFISQNVMPISDWAPFL